MTIYFIKHDDSVVQNIHLFRILKQSILKMSIREERVVNRLNTKCNHVSAFNSQDGTTPLILAAAGGNIHCVLELLEQGAELNSRRSTGTTALFFAAQGGHLDVVRILLKARAKVDTPSLDGGTPLFVAAQGGHVKIIRELLDCGADVNACMKVSS